MDELSKNDLKNLKKNNSRYTEWGEQIDKVYTPYNINDIDYQKNIGMPGEYPFTRGIHKEMYLRCPWTMRSYSGFGSAEETNERFKYLISQGQTGLSVAFDLPTQLGYDSDNPICLGEVGRVGVPVSSLYDMERLFQDLSLDQLSTSMTINAPASILLAMYFVVAEKMGIPLNKIRGTIQNDILKEYTVRGTYIFPPNPSMKLIRDTVVYCSENAPLFNVINVAGYHYREAGCTASQEIAFSFANAIEYIETCLDAGLDIDSFAPRISWIFDTSNKIFEEISKYRAARKVWAEIIKEKYKAKNPKSWMLRFHTHTSGISLASQQPENNIARIAYHVLGAVLGGAQSIAACSYDEAIALPTESAAALSLRTQQIVLEETGVTDTVDPMGGSYYVESLTMSIAEDIKKILNEIEKMGGAVKAVEKGYMQKEIDRGAFYIHKSIENKEKIIVGVNKYKQKNWNKINKFQYDEKSIEKHVLNLDLIKRKRNADDVMRALNNIKAVAKKSDNIMPHLIDAVKTYATLGEICGVLKEIYGEY